MRQGRRWLACALFLLPLASSPGAGLPDYGADLLADALLGTDRNVNGVPDDWAELREPGFRAFPGSIRVEGEALRLFLNGRNVGVETIRPIPVQRGASYRLEGSCRAEGFRKGAPEAAVCWLDASGSVLGSERLVLPCTEAWTSFRFDMEAVPPQARSLRVRLIARGAEVKGTAWFEALSLFRAPRFVVEGLPPGHLLLLPGPSAVSLSLGGLDAGAYRLEASLADLDGQERWRLERSLDLPQGASRIPLEIPLPGEGSFHIAFTLSRAAHVVASHETLLNVLSVLPPRPPVEDSAGGELGMPGVFVAPRPDAALSQIPLLEALLPAVALVEVRPPEAGSEGATWGRYPADLLLRRMVRSGVHCVGLLGERGPAARATVLRYFSEVNDWALRGPEDSWKEIEPWAGSLPRPVRWGVLLPGSFLPGTPFRFAVLPEGARPSSQGLEPWRVLDLGDSEGTRRDLRAFSLRALGEMLAGRSLLLRLDDRPGGLLRTDGAVRAEFLAWRTLSQAFRGARGLGEIPLSPRVQAHALRQGVQTLVVAWAREPGKEEWIEVPTVHPVVAIDLMGGVEILQPSHGRVTLRVGDLPRCFLDVSSGWLRTRTTMRFDQAVLAARCPSRRTFTFENGFGTLLTGSLELRPPRGWRVVPERLPVSVPPGGTFAAELTLFPNPYEATGPEGRELRLEAELDFADGRLAPMLASVPFRFAPAGIESRVSTWYQAEGEMIRVSQQISDRSGSALACDAFLSVAGRPEQVRPLGRLKDGEVREVEYMIPWRDLLAGEPLVGVRELEGERRFVIGGLRGE